MKIHRKEIIKSIIAESAIEHGFKLEWGTRTRTTWYILSMTREGLGQCVHFVENSVFPGVLCVMGIYKEDIFLKYDINDEESYKKIISEVNDIFENDGYRILDERLQLPELVSADYDFVAGNYTDLANAFCIDKKINIQQISLVKAIKLISISITEIENKKWTDVKAMFYQIAGFYLYMLLSIEGLELYREQINDDLKTLEIRRTDNKYVSMTVLQCLFGYWLDNISEDEIQREIHKMLNYVLTINEMTKLDIKVEEWKRFNESLAQDED